MSFTEKLAKFEDRHNELEQLLSNQEILSDPDKIQKFGKELSDIKELVEKYREYKATETDIHEIQNSKDPDFKELLKELEAKSEKLKEEIEFLLLPKDPNDDKNIFVEIRCGTGGEEAALFAGELFRMYLRYAERRNLKVEILEAAATGLGGYKEAIFTIQGKGSYSRLKYESGTHRVQRVPATEASGRVHTSAATVAVLPEVAEVDVKIDDKDLRVDTFRSSGPGGQNVNKTSSAIRVTHIPSGLVVECQEERSQHQNRAKAMGYLRARLYAMEEAKRKDEISQMRKIQVGSGDRSEKIRTYNYAQSRITDHRIGLSVFNFQGFLDGDLDEIIDALAAADRVAKLEASIKAA